MTSIDTADTTPGRRIWPDILAIFAGLIGFLFVPAFMCGCGHLGSLGFAVTIPITAAGWFAFVGGDRNGVVFRLFRMMVVVGLTLMLAKNIGDVLWFGHDTVF